jgi:hypothetical protein
MGADSHSNSTEIVPEISAKNLAILAVAFSEATLAGSYSKLGPLAAIEHTARAKRVNTFRFGLPGKSIASVGSDKR